MSHLLAFDTATDRMAVALGAGDTIWVHEGEAGTQASLTLLPAIFGLLDEAGLALRDLDAIGFGRGPGAFTGLRTAASVAQGLAAGSGKPVLVLDTLQAIALAAFAKHGLDDWWAATDARMHEVYAAHYTREAGRWCTAVAPALYTIDALNALWRLAAPRAVAGNACAVYADRLNCGTARLAADATPNPPALLALARAAWEEGASVDASQALPLYLRDKVAFTSAERDAMKAAKAAAAA